MPDPVLELAERGRVVPPEERGRLLMGGISLRSCRTGRTATVCASKPAAGSRAPLRFGGRRVRRLPCGAQARGPSPNSLHSLRSFRSDMRRQVSPRSALRARATSLPLLGAEEALRPAAGCGFAGTRDVGPGASLSRDWGISCANGFIQGHSGFLRCSSWCSRLRRFRPLESPLNGSAQQRVLCSSEERSGERSAPSSTTASTSVDETLRVGGVCSLAFLRQTHWRFVCLSE